MNKDNLVKIKHDINSATNSVKIILEMVLKGTITKSDEPILKDAISKMDLLSNCQTNLFKELSD